MRPIEQLNQRALENLELLKAFPENQSSAQPITISTLEPLPSPAAQRNIPLPVRKTPPRVLIADDEEAVIEGLRRSLEAKYGDALDVRFWQPGTGESLVAMVRCCLQEGWRPDVVVIDINFDDGGKHGVHYLEDLRKEPGCAALAIVLATGNQYSDLYQGKLTVGVNWTREDPAEWLRKAKPFEPEALLYGKTADALFLGRIGEHSADWKRAARRRAWGWLLAKVAQKLDGVAIRVGDVAEEIVQYVVAELEIDHAFVRQRQSDGKYKLVVVAPSLAYVEKGDTVTVDEVPILKEIVGKSREPVFEPQLSAKEADRLVGEQVAGMRFLGVGCALGNRNVGFIMLLRRPEHEPFEEEVDGHYIRVLAQLLASTLGVATLRDRQTRLLDFAAMAASELRREKVCDTLAAILHEEIHQCNDCDAKVTVRLLDWGTGELRRFSLLGFSAKGERIHLTEQDSIYAKVVRGNELRRIEDCYNERVRQTAKEGMIGSELCVPLPIGKYAIGAVNLEHREVDFYREYDEEFVKAAATTAANAIERIRTAKLLEGMTDFVHRFASEDTKHLNQRLRELLYEFCGYSVLVDLTRGDGEAVLWQVSDVEYKFQTEDTAKQRQQSKDEADLKQQIESIYATNWEGTWVGRLYKQQARDWGWAEFTDNESDFEKINLTPRADKPTYQKADAILWLRRGEDASPHRALVLMWGLPPPMSGADVILLGNMARLFSELEARRQTIRELIDKNVIGEQAAEIGHVMQHFRHRLGNLTGGQQNHIDALEAAYCNHDQEGFMKAVAALRENARDIANSFHRSRGYVKAVEMKNIRVIDIVNRATADLQGRLQDVILEISVPDDLMAETDFEIAALALYSVFENALDATRDRPKPQIQVYAEVQGNHVALRVMDNGPSVPETIRKHLFEWGMTTKTDGLGSALAFARRRMRLLRGDLVFPLPQPRSGALFEMRLARPTLQEDLR